MTSSLLESAADILKLAPRYFAPAGIVAGALLMMPREWLEVLGVAQLAEDNRPVVGLIFLFCCAVLVCACISSVAEAVRGVFGRRSERASMAEKEVAKERAIAERKRGILERLRRLTEDEKQILRFYVHQQTRSNVLRIDDGVVQGLVAAGIIFRSAQLGSMVHGFAHNITETAWEALNEDQSLLLGSTQVYRTDQDSMW